MKIKYIRTKHDIHNNNRVLKLAKSTSRVFVIYTDRKYKNGGSCSAEFVKNERIYNPFFDIPDHGNNEEYGKTLEELIAEGFNLKYAGYHGDGQDTYWNNTWWNQLDLVVMSRLLN
jgi:hypothetical protein